MSSPKNFRWNYFAHTVDGGLYIGSMTLLNANTILPAAVSVFGGPDWLVSLMPSMMLIGFSFMPLFSAHLVERMGRVHPFLIGTGITQRIPLLLTGIILICPGSPVWLLCASVALCHLFAGAVSGIGQPAWQQLVTHTIPPQRRSSLFAVRNLIGSLLGLAVALWVKQTLANHPGAAGYGRLHLYSFAILCVSLFFFTQIREAPQSAPLPHEHRSFWKNLWEIPEVLRPNPQFVLYLLTSACFNGLFILLPFLAIHFLKLLNRPKSDVGIFIASQMVGGIVGNFIAGWSGDRDGGKRVLVASQIALCATAIIAFQARGVGLCKLVFFGVGVVVAMRGVGSWTLLLELAPEKRRATALALASFVQVGSLFAASGIATLLWRWTGFSSIALATIVFSLLSLFLLFRIREPRHAGDATPVVEAEN